MRPLLAVPHSNIKSIPTLVKPGTAHPPPEAGPNRLGVELLKLKAALLGLAAAMQAQCEG